MPQKRKRTPQEKKRLSLEKDRRVHNSPHNKAIRKQTPRWKAESNRYIHRNDHVDIDDEDESFEAKNKIRTRQKWKVYETDSLKETIERKKFRRENDVGAKIRRRKIMEIREKHRNGLMDQETCLAKIAEIQY